MTITHATVKPDTMVDIMHDTMADTITAPTVTEAIRAIGTATRTVIEVAAEASAFKVAASASA